MRAALALEARASEVLGLHQDALPAVLHSPAYVARQPVPPPTASRADYENRAASERRWRDQMLTGLAGRYRMVVGVQALYYLHARFPDIVHEQSGHLLNLIDQHRVTLQILPTTDLQPADVPHGLIILRRLPHQTDQAYLQQDTNWIAVPDMAAHLVKVWHLVHRVALPAADTHAHLHRMYETGDMSTFGPVTGGPNTNRATPL